MSRNILPNSVSYDALNGKDIFSTPQKDMLDVNILISHKEHKDSSQVRRISKKLMVLIQKYIFLIKFLKNNYYNFYYLLRILIRFSFYIL